jgi:hypothetical protein
MRPSSKTYREENPGTLQVNYVGRSVKEWTCMECCMVYLFLLEVLYSFEEGTVFVSLHTFLG